MAIRDDVGGKIYTVDIEVGLLLFRQFREFLKRLKFKGYQIEWMESKGWVERTFTIKSPSIAILEEIKKSHD